MTSNTIALLEQHLSTNFNIFIPNEFKNEELKTLSIQAMNEGVDPRTLLSHGEGRQNQKFSLLEVYFRSTDIKELETRKDYFMANLDKEFFKSLFFIVDSTQLQGDKKLKLLISWGFNPNFVATNKTFIDYNKDLIGLTPLHFAKNATIIKMLLENGANIKQKMKIPFDEQYQELINQNIKQITQYEQFWHYYIQPLKQKDLIDDYWYEVHKNSFINKRHSLNIQSLKYANIYLSCYWEEPNAFDYAKLHQEKNKILLLEPYIDQSSQEKAEYILSLIHSTDKKQYKKAKNEFLIQMKLDNDYMLNHIELFKDYIRKEYIYFDMIDLQKMNWFDVIYDKGIIDKINPKYHYIERACHSFKTQSFIHLYHRNIIEGLDKWINEVSSQMNTHGYKDPFDREECGTFVPIGILKFLFEKGYDFKHPTLIARRATLEKSHLESLIESEENHKKLKI